MSDTARNPLREVGSWVTAVARGASVVASTSLVMAGLVAVTAPPASAATGASTTIPIFADAGVVTGIDDTTGMVTYPTLQNLSATMTVTPNNPGSGVFDGPWCMEQDPCGYWGGVNTYAPESPFTPASVENTDGITVFFAAYGNGTTKPPSACSNLPVSLAAAGSPGDNFNCGQVATVSFVFNRPVTDPTMQLFNLGGIRGIGAYGVSAYSNWTVTSGQSLTMDDSLGNIMLDDSRIQVITPSSTLDMSPTGTGAASFTVHGTFTTLSFDVGMNLQNQDPGAALALNPADPILEFVPEAVAFQFSTSGTATIYDYSWTTSPSTPVSKDLNEANSPGLVYTTTPVTPPSHGQVVLNANGTYTYTPNNGFYGTDSFVYQACSTASTPQCATRTVTVTVPSPAPPVSVLAVSDYYTTPMNTPMTKGDAAAKDVAEGTTLAGATWRPLDAPAHGTVSGWDNATGKFTYTPDKDWYGTDSFRYIVCLASPYDGTCSIATEYFTVLPTVTAVDDYYSTPMDTPMTTGDARAGDSSAVPGGIAGSTVTQTSQPAHGTVSWNPANDGTFTYTPNPDWYGTDSFTYRICLAAPYEEACDEATEYITVAPPITAVNDYYSTALNTPMTQGNARAGDSSPAGLQGATLTQTSQPAHGTVSRWDPATGRFTYTPDRNWSGTDSFTYRICLAAPYEDVCAEATELITVGPVSVTAADDYYTTALNTPMTRGNAKAGDASPAGLKGAMLTRTSQPQHGRVTGWDPATGRFTYTPDRNWSGTDSFTYRICLAAPNQDVCDSATQYVTVGPASVMAVDDYYSTPYGRPMTQGNAKAGDSSPAGLKGATLTRTSQPQHGRVTGWDPATGRFTYTPDRNWSGTDSFTYRICLAAPDQDVCDSATEYITVSPPKPGAKPVTPPFTEDFGLDPATTTHTFDPMASFIPSKGAKALPSTLSLLKPGSSKWTNSVTVRGQGTFTIIDGKVKFVADPTFVGTASIRYRAQDSSGQWAESTLTVEVAWSHPIASPLRKDLGIWQMAQPYTFNALKVFTPSQGAKAVTSSLAIAPMGTSAWGKRVEVPGKGIFALAGNGKVTYTGPACYTGNVTVRYRAQDSTGQWADSTLTIKVANPGGKEICRL